jgi:hypothetical protein
MEQPASKAKTSRFASRSEADTATSGEKIIDPQIFQDAKLAEILHWLAYNSCPEAKYGRDDEIDHHRFRRGVYDQIKIKLRKTDVGKLFGKIYRDDPSSTFFNFAVRLEKAYCMVNSGSLPTKRLKPGRKDRRQANSKKSVLPSIKKPKASSESSKKTKQIIKNSYQHFIKCLEEQDQHSGRIATKLLVNVGHPDDCPDLFFPMFLEKVLRPHQVDGVRFMWNVLCQNESTDVNGCVLAHSMGLGKFDIMFY